MPKVNFFSLIPVYLEQQGETDEGIQDFKEYEDHIAVILHDFRKTIIPKAALQTIHDAAQRAEAVAAAVVEVTAPLLDDPEPTTTSDDDRVQKSAATSQPPAAKSKRGKK